MPIPVARLAEKTDEVPTARVVQQTPEQIKERLRVVMAEREVVEKQIEIERAKTREALALAKVEANKKRWDEVSDKLDGMIEKFLSSGGSPSFYIVFKYIVFKYVDHVLGDDDLYDSDRRIFFDDIKQYLSIRGFTADSTSSSMWRVEPTKQEIGCVLA